MNRHYLLIFLMAVIFTSIIQGCSESIPVDTISRSSEFISCQLTYGANYESLHYRNECWIQTGIIDTTSESPPIPVAIIYINKKEIILPRQSENDNDDHFTEIYADQQYTLIISCAMENDESGGRLYKGVFRLTSGGRTHEHKVVAIGCEM